MQSSNVTSIEGTDRSSDTSLSMSAILAGLRDEKVASLAGAVNAKTDPNVKTKASGRKLSSDIDGGEKKSKGSPVKGNSSSSLSFWNSKARAAPGALVVGAAYPATNSSNAPSGEEFVPSPSALNSKRSKAIDDSNKGSSLYVTPTKSPPVARSVKAKSASAALSRPDSPSVAGVGIVSNSARKNSSNSRTNIVRSPSPGSKRNSISSTFISSDDFSHENSTAPVISPEQRAENAAKERLRKFETLLQRPNVDLDSLRRLSWRGIPECVRGRIWRVLLEYLPTNRDRRDETLQRKQQEYFDCLSRYIDVPERAESERKAWAQIEIDMLRTHPDIKLFRDSDVQYRLLRVLFIWATRHPASGYVQGINELTTPFFIVFLAESLNMAPVEVLKLRNLEDVHIESNALDCIEADVYWCVSKLLDGIQDHYTFAQPGIQELTHRVDPPLHEHLLSQEANIYMQVAFRWMNCLLMREIPLIHIMRLWDTYLSDENGDGFAAFHAYVCTAFLVRFTEQLRQLEYQEIVLFLQNVITLTNNWTERDLEDLLSQAFLWSSLFEGAPSHLKPRQDEEAPRW